MRTITNYIRQIFCKHDFEIEITADKVKNDIYIAKNVDTTLNIGRMYKTINSKIT